LAAVLITARSVDRAPLRLSWNVHP
jgi:hypothetical protein